jgi:murein DD-endopeptidase MepM/ murein hydrolase activator NlpD
LAVLALPAGVPAARPIASAAAHTHSTSDPALAARPSIARAGAAYALPLPGPLHVLRRFEPPPTPYSAGHRGVDLEAGAGPVVLAAASGVVSFAGPVAGRGVVVIAHPDGIRTEYEPVAALVVAGQAVVRGQPIGRLAGRHDRWPPGRCLHWGARRGDTYLDPLQLRRPLGPVRLLPWPR